MKQSSEVIDCTPVHACKALRAGPRVQGGCSGGGGGVAVVVVKRCSFDVQIKVCKLAADHRLSLLNIGVTTAAVSWFDFALF